MRMREKDGGTAESSCSAGCGGRRTALLLGWQLVVLLQQQQRDPQQQERPPQHQGLQGPLRSSGSSSSNPSNRCKCRWGTDGGALLANLCRLLCSSIPT